MREGGKEVLSPVQERVVELQEKKRLEMLKKGEYVGAFRVHRFYAQFSRYMELTEMIRLVESNAQEAYGMDIVTFCKEVLGIHYNSFNNQRSLLKDVQPHVIAAIKALGYSDHEIRLLKTTEDEAVKALMSKGILKVDDVEIQTTPENMPKIMKYFEKVIKRKDELEAEKEQWEKEKQSIYDTRKSNNEKLAKKDLEIKRLQEQLEDKKMPLDDREAIAKIQNLKIQLCGVIRLLESADVKKYSEEVKEELLLTAQYAHDRGELFLGRMLDALKHDRPALEEAEENFLAKWDKDEA